MAEPLLNFRDVGDPFHLGELLEFQRDQRA